MPVYNKLVRDKIPEIINESGKNCTVRVLDDEQYRLALKEKLSEELIEYNASQSDEEALEELADLLELIHSLSHVHGANVDQLEGLREDKARKRGGFADKVFLVEVED